MFPTFWIYCSPIFWWNNTRKLRYLTSYLNSANKLFHLTNEKFLRRMFDEDTIPLLPKITRIKLIFYQFADPEKKNPEENTPFFTKKKSPIALSTQSNQLKTEFPLLQNTPLSFCSSLSSPPSQSTLRPFKFRVSYREANSGSVKKNAIQKSISTINEKVK